MNKILFFLIPIVFSISVSAQNNQLEKAGKAFADANYTLCLQESLSGIEQVNADSASKALFYAYAGLSSEKLSQSSEAIAYYRHSVDYKVPRLDIYSKLMLLAKAEGDNASYEYVLVSQAKEFPDFAEDVFVKLNSHYYRTKQYGQLEKNAKQLLLLWPDDVRGNYYLAYAYQEQNNISEAKRGYRKVLDLDANHKSSNIALGVLLYKEGTAICKEETANYKSMTKPSHVDYHDYMQRLELGKLVLREALPYLLKGYELKPSESLKSLIKNSYIRIGEAEKADQY